MFDLERQNMKDLAAFNAEQERSAKNEEQIKAQWTAMDVLRYPRLFDFVARKMKGE